MHVFRQVAGALRKLAAGQGAAARVVAAWWSRPPQLLVACADKATYDACRRALLASDLLADDEAGRARQYPNYPNIPHQAALAVADLTAAGSLGSSSSSTLLPSREKKAALTTPSGWHVVGSTRALRERKRDAQTEQRLVAWACGRCTFDNPPGRNRLSVYIRRYASENERQVRRVRRAAPARSCAL